MMLWSELPLRWARVWGRHHSLDSHRRSNSRNHGRNVWLAAVQTIMYLRYGSKTATTYVEKLSGRAQRTAS
jgi:hypothetical protein